MTSPYRSVTEHLLSLTADQRAGGSEFGGVDGLTSPYPHEPSTSERLHALYGTDTTDPESFVFTDEAAPPNYFRED